MRFRSFLMGSLALITFAFAHEESPPPSLSPDYGVDRIGSMNTDGYGVIAYGDFLYWTAHMDGLELALQLTPLVDVSGTGALFKNNTSTVEPSFNWDPAFRVGLGYYFKWRDWDVSLEWTRLCTHTSVSREAGNNHLVPFWGRIAFAPNVPSILLSISGKWDFDYDTLDLLFHPGYFRYKFFAIQPEVGVRGAWIDWKYTINQTFLDTADQVIETQHFPFKNDFHAVGLVVGFNTKWFMGCGLHLYTRSLASVLYGHFDVRQFARTEVLQRTFESDFREKFWDVRSNLHLAMGLEWERYFANNSVLLNLHVGYEFLAWFNQNQLYRSRVEPVTSNVLDFTTNIERDDLGMNGLTVGARLEF